MAELLADLGQISDEALAGEQRRQLEMLHEQTEPGSTDRLRVAYWRARALWNAAPAQQDDTARDEAIDLLAAALVERQNACGGMLGDEAERPMETLVEFHKDRGHFTKAESLLLDHLKTPLTTEYRECLEEQLDDTYLAALDQGGRVSLGEGAELYRRLHDRFLDHLKQGKGVTLSGDPFSEPNRVRRFHELVTIAHNRGIEAGREDLRRMVVTTLPEGVGRACENSEDLLDEILEELGDTVERILGPRAALAFAVALFEHAPSYWPHRYEWNRLLESACQWRMEIADLGDLEPRFLAIVLQSLRHGLRSRYAEFASAGQQSTRKFWESKVDDFARVAEEVLLDRNDIGDATSYIAEYFHEGLRRTDRAIEILRDARGRGILSIDNESELVDYLFQAGRFEECIESGRSLVERRPDNIEYRGKLMRAFHDAGRADDLARLGRDTEDFCRKNDLWHEEVIATLAEACLDAGLYSQAADYYRQAISRRLRDWPRRANDETLFKYYSQQAVAYSDAKETAKAVEAATSAIVCWSPRHKRRHGAIIALERALWHCGDLNAYVRELDEKCQSEGTDSALLRRAIGNVYSKKGQYRKALIQFELARELQPNDIEIHKDILHCFNGLDDTLGAIDALLAHARLDRSQIELYQRVANRFEKLGLPDQAERAVTTMVEMLPNEAESHSRVATIRQKQGRWADAADHWREVVRIRSLEPTGLLKLAEAQIQMNQREEAAKTLDRLRVTEWPAHFGDVPAQVRLLEKKLDAANEEGKR